MSRNGAMSDPSPDNGSVQFCALASGGGGASLACGYEPGRHARSRAQSRALSFRFSVLTCSTRYPCRAACQCCGAESHADPRQSSNDAAASQRFSVLFIILKTEGCEALLNAIMGPAPRHSACARHNGLRVVRRSRPATTSLLGHHLPAEDRRFSGPAERHR